jgi:hypothetical protein
MCREKDSRPECGCFEGEVEGEKAVTCDIFEQARRNRDSLAAVKSELAAIKARLDNHDGEFALLKTVLSTHTAMLNVLVQDVGLSRAALALRDLPAG